MRCLSAIWSNSAHRLHDCRMIASMSLSLCLICPQRIGKNPQALDDLIKETASKMACCPFFLPEPVLVRQVRETWHDFQIPSKTWAAPSFKKLQHVPCKFYAIPSAGRCRRQGCEGFLWTASVSSLHLGAAQPSRRSKKITKWREVNADCPQSMGHASQEPSSRQQPWKELKKKLGVCSSTPFLHQSTCPRILTTWLAD